MPKGYYLGLNDEGIAALLENIAAKLGGHLATLTTITNSDLTSVQADAKAFRYLVTLQDLVQNYAQQITSNKNLYRGGNAPSAPAPAGFTLPTPLPPVVAPGIVPRLRSLVGRIKNDTGYVDSIGQDLNIEGPEQTGPDFSNFAPVLDLSINGGRVEVGWSWQGCGKYLDMIEILVDRGDGKGFVLLAHDTTTPSYVDTTPLPASPAIWKYKAIYMVGDQRVGQWSVEYSITVGG